MSNQNPTPKPTPEQNSLDDELRLAEIVQLINEPGISRERYTKLSREAGQIIGRQEQARADAMATNPLPRLSNGEMGGAAEALEKVMNRTFASENRVEVSGLSIDPLITVVAVSSTPDLGLAVFHFEARAGGDVRSGLVGECSQARRVTSPRNPQEFVDGIVNGLWGENIVQHIDGPDEITWTWAPEKTQLPRNREHLREFVALNGGWIGA